MAEGVCLSDYYYFQTYFTFTMRLLEVQPPVDLVKEKEGQGEWRIERETEGESLP
jgi:hypothetical protein